MTVNGSVSHWLAQLGPQPQRRPALPGDRTVDVCVVGAGFTGLWTAYYLSRADPALRIVVLEAEFAGFGASGRNGGWLAGLLPGSARRWAKLHGAGPVRQLQAAVNETVDEVIAVAARESIDADIVKGGVLEIARTPAQEQRLRLHAAEDPDTRLLTSAEQVDRIRLTKCLAAAWNPHGARVQPAKLVRGLADAVERHGVTIHEDTVVTRISPGLVTTPHGTVTAPIVLRATEGFTTRLPGYRRDWLPMNSSMIVTEPLDEASWTEIGWHGAETLGDAAHGYIYAQRTADGRIAIGGRGIPYRYGSRFDDSGHTSPATINALRKTLADLFPPTRGIDIAHAWSGVLAVPRDWCATVELDHASGLGLAGGYTGHGVAASNLAGRTLADLVLHRETPLTRLPWVAHRTKTWEPEPLRWLGVRGLYLAYRLADRHESAGGRTSPIARAADFIARRP
ncbi:glycine/D-amino acid oxidase-like deaminating enzyme [Kibdelosporangium banguiense]|uniref:Glycine/D-amino acid oxidase-like deaminating enzyme n=1 Tax=Kibdelosporangium banguiense TaxID=1365924 RepID=A0ABS4TXS9_9PSEU|nr:FAD-binding oxidoreductase [Kibdelosporangium banguiense]MBP2329208.1 glycine/D-amino acid oxidase-like deaminating enzyme [Kibdelosporangium banguiense]